MEPAKYSAQEVLRTGGRLEIRALRPDDRSALLKAVEDSSANSLYRRFFAVRRHFTEREIAFFVNVDFVNHVALVAEADDGSCPIIVGIGRFIVVEPGIAEIALAVIDEYQGRGVGTVLVSHLIGIAGKTGLKELRAEVLPDNVAMLKVLTKCGLPISITRAPEMARITLKLT